MLDESSYLTAIYCYTGAAAIMLLYLAWWLGRRWSGAWATLAVLLSAAFLLTPAYPDESASTMAPAAIVAGFQLLTDGPEAAQAALKPLAIMAGAAVVLALLARLLIFRPRKTAPVEAGPAAGSDGDAQ